MAENFILIPGRTSKQGVGISEGKFGETYIQEITLLQVAPEDMERLGLEPGDWVRLTSADGQVEVEVAQVMTGQATGRRGRQTASVTGWRRLGRS